MNARASLFADLKILGGSVVRDVVAPIKMVGAEIVINIAAAIGLACSGLMKPDTHLGENARHIEVSDDQATSCLFR